MAKAKKDKMTLEDALVPVGEQPYEVPENWCWTRIHCVADVIMGQSPSGESTTDDSKFTPLIGGAADMGEMLPNVSRYTKEPIKMSQKDDLILCVRATLGRPIYSDGKYCLGRGVSAIRSKYLTKEFLRYYYIYNEQYLYNNATGTTFAQVTSKVLENMPISLPTLAEQQRIVDQIENLFSKLDEAKEKAQNIIDTHTERKAAIINKAFCGELTQKWRSENSNNAKAFLDELDTKMSNIRKKKSNKVSNEFENYIEDKIPDEWVYADLERISILITDGEHKTPNRVDEYCGYYLLSARNIHNDMLKLDDVDYIDEAEFEKIGKRCNPKRDDVLISCSGSVGRCCVVEDDNQYCMVRSAAMVSLIGGNPRFVMYMIQSGYVQEQIKKLSKQTAQANLFQGAISALLIPFPSLEEQNEIVRILDNVLYSINQAYETADSVITQIDLMKKSILAKAFRGELGTNNPEEESSIELLKDILANQ